MPIVSEHEREQAMRKTVPGIERDRLFETALRLNARSRFIPRQPVSPHRQVVGVGPGWRRTPEVLGGARIDPPHQGSDDCSDHLVLNNEELSDGPIESFGPHVIAGPGIDELRGDPDALTNPPDTALYQKISSELAPCRTNVDDLTLE